MSNELATRNTAELDLSPATILTTASGTVDLAAWAQEMQAASVLGITLCKTDFVPKDFRGKPEAATAAILAGKSLGMDPLSALQNIFVIHGRPGLYARTMHALVIAQGHEVIRTEATPESVTVQARRKGTSEWQSFTWTMQRASTAGYVKSNAKYKENPIEMLTAKALSEACRVIAPDVLTGVAAYAVEELEDMGERPAQASSGVTALAAMAAQPAAAKAANPVVTGEIPPEVLANVERALGEGSIGDYIEWLKANGAPHHILEYAQNAAAEAQEQ